MVHNAVNSTERKYCSTEICAENGTLLQFKCAIPRADAVHALELRHLPGQLNLLRQPDHVAHQRIDLVLPAPAAEHAVVAGARLHVVGAQVGAQLAAQVLRGQGLAGRADVVAFALDRDQRGAADRRGAAQCGSRWMIRPRKTVVCA